MIARSPDFEKLAALMGTPALSASSAPNGWGKPVLKRPQQVAAPVTDAAIKLAACKEAVSFAPFQAAGKLLNKVPRIGRLFNKAGPAIRPPNPFTAGGPSSFVPQAAPTALSGARKWLNSTPLFGRLATTGMIGMGATGIGSNMLDAYATTRGMVDHASGYPDGAAAALGTFANAPWYQRMLGAISPDAMVNEGLKAKQQAMPWLIQRMGGTHMLSRMADGYKRITEAARAGKPLTGVNKLAPVGGMPQYTQGANLGDYGQQLSALQQQIASLGQQLQRGVGASALPPAM